MIDASFCEEHLAQTREFAARVGATAELERRLEYLATYAEGTPAWPTRCVLSRDFAPHSFHLVMYRADGEPWFNGGLIYQGPGVPADGSMESLTVSMANDPPVHSWGVHT